MENTQLLLQLSRIALVVSKDEKLKALDLIISLMEQINQQQEEKHGE